MTLTLYPGCLTAILLVTSVSPAFSQVLTFGVKGGIPLTAAYSATRDFSATTRRYLVGPTVEFRLPQRFAFELDALYQRIGYSKASVLLPAPGSPFATSELYLVDSLRVRGNSWQFPFLVKYHFKEEGAQPFVDAGPVYRYHSETTIRVRNVSVPVSGPPTIYSSEGTGVPSSFSIGKQNSAGIALGAGFTVKGFRMRVSPEIRYTRWFTQPFATVATAFNGAVHSADNQADVILGITF